MKNFDYFLKTVKEKKCTENMIVDLEADLINGNMWTGILAFCVGPLDKFRSSALKKLSDAIASGDCKSGLIIKLDGNFSGNRRIKTLATCLKSPNRPENLSFYLQGNGIGNTGMKYIAESLKQAPKKIPGLKLDLSGGHIIKDEFGDGFDNNDIGDKGAIALADCLETIINNDKCPSNLYINLAKTKIGNAGACAIADALERVLKGKPSRQTITLILPTEKIDYHLSARIQNALQKLATLKYNTQNGVYTNNASVLFTNACVNSKDQYNNVGAAQTFKNICVSAN